MVPLNSRHTPNEKAESSPNKFHSLPHKRENGTTNGDLQGSPPSPNSIFEGVGIQPHRATAHRSARVFLGTLGAQAKPSSSTIRRRPPTKTQAHSPGQWPPHGPQPGNACRDLRHAHVCLGESNSCRWPEAGYNQFVRVFEYV